MKVDFFFLAQKAEEIGQSKFTYC